MIDRRVFTNKLSTNNSNLLPEYKFNARATTVLGRDIKCKTIAKCAFKLLMSNNISFPTHGRIVSSAISILSSRTANFRKARARVRDYTRVYHGLPRPPVLV